MTHPLKKQILAMRGKKSYGLIAAQLGITRGVVSGICFRADHGNTKYRKKRRRCGPGKYAKHTLAQLAWGFGA